jgi:conjugative transfer signal peptidase TraF
LALAATIALPPRPLLVWNASASAPVGLYSVGHVHTLAAGDMVIVRLAEPMRGLAARRHYLPANVPLVKRVAGVPGDTVCAVGTTIRVNGVPVAQRMRRDRAGRPMPWWTGCVTLGEGALFVLMPGNAASFDGRYFGPVLRDNVVGKAILLWPR